MGCFAFKSGKNKAEKQRRRPAGGAAGVGIGRAEEQGVVSVDADEEHPGAVGGEGRRAAAGVRDGGARQRHQRLQPRAQGRRGRLRLRQAPQPAQPAGAQAVACRSPVPGRARAPEPGEAHRLLRGGFRRRQAPAAGLRVHAQQDLGRPPLQPSPPATSLENEAADHDRRRARPRLPPPRSPRSSVIWQVIYRDFKASNVLLDGDFRPKLSDFGLAREGPTEGRTHVSTAVVGTHGYAAPDYIETGHLTVKSDVWGFGVVLYEILTGRRSVERNLPAEEQKLLGWVRQHPPGADSFRTIMDPRLGGRYQVAAARETARLADRCLGKNPKERPSMGEVVEELERVAQMEPAPPPAPATAKR